ncbi:MAG TPA: flavodoxin family protein [Desulfobacteraceae bacterium]|nr:flavodoxin family protein [Desulfobacteraceae bacterium]HPJ68006.1 flavodoxin family protein [Desulfobacteraceae bacterium]
MKKHVLGIYGSPRKEGSTDQLLDMALEGARSIGADIFVIYVRDLKMVGCKECGGCEKTGKCVINDDMSIVYPLLDQADIIFLASPIFFYGLTSQVKAVVDRAQAVWSRRMLEKTPEQRKIHTKGKGYLIAVGATTGKRLFDGVELTARYFFDALDMSYNGGLFFRGIEKPSDIAGHPDVLEKAFAFGRKAAGEE